MGKEAWPSSMATGEVRKCYSRWKTSKFQVIRNIKKFLFRQRLYKYVRKQRENRLANSLLSVRTFVEVFNNDKLLLFL